MNVLITGGAGFIGSHLAKLLSARGHTVTVLDNLSPQIHNTPAFDTSLQDVARCIHADVRDRDTLADAIADAEVVVHLAAETGTGQSMYAIHHYSDVNVLALAGLLDILMNTQSHVRRVVLASSRAVYGEGQYLCPDCGIFSPPARSAAQLAQHQWDIVCPTCGARAQPIPTREDALLQPQSIYASNKQTQEQLVTITCQARGIEAVVLRYQNVYGPGQSLKNPYTGMIGIFFSLLVQGKPILLFEDGEPSRDFVYIDDVAAATAAAVDRPIAAGQTVNVGMGLPIAVREVAATLGIALGVDPEMVVTQKGRIGDIRHCYADTTRLVNDLGYTPQVDFSEGIRRYVDWALTQRESTQDVADRFARAQDELIARKLFR